MSLISEQGIERQIYVIRGYKVMLDFDIATLYEVETKTLKRAVKRNGSRFPCDFMFELTSEEINVLRCQIGTSKTGRGGTRYAPYAFTEQGVSMLSSVLHSPHAIQVNITIMRAFVRLRELAVTHKDLSQRLSELETKFDSQFKVVFQAIRSLMSGPRKTRPTIWFHNR